MHDRLFQAGDRCDEYTIVGFLGSGGFAEVYAAYHTETCEQVAIKCLKLQHGENEFAVQRMLAEAQLLAKVGHQNLVEVLDFGKSGNMLYMVMELLHGHTLRDEIRKASPRIPLERALYIALEIADGLDAAHEARVVHRDLKPDNVFLTEDGRVKVLDLGAGKFYGWGLASTAPGLIVGTPLYMAPEHVKGGDVDGRTDVYALGVMLYEMCGEHPLVKMRHQGASKAEIALLQIQYEPPPLHSAHPEVPAYVSEIVMKALAKRPDDRFGSMSEMARALRRARARVREELGVAVKGGAVAMEERVSRPNGIGTDGPLLASKRPGSVVTPSTAVTPGGMVGGTDPMTAPSGRREAGRGGAALVGRGGADPFRSPASGSAAEVLVTAAGTVRMSVPSLEAIDERTVPLPPRPRGGVVPSDAGRPRGVVSGVSQDREAHTGSGAPATGGVRTESGLSADGGVRSPSYRQAGVLVLGFGLGVVLMGFVMLWKGLAAPGTEAPGASAGSVMAPGLGPVPGGSPESSAVTPGALPSSTALPAVPREAASAQAVEPAGVGTLLAAPSAGSVASAAPSPAEKKAPKATAGPRVKPAASPKAPPKHSPGRPKQEAPDLIFE